MEWLATIFSTLNEFANLITALATAVLAILTGTLWFENRRLRKAGTSPDVVAYLASHPDGSGAVNFVLANVGRGPAYNVEFEFINDEADFEAHRVLLLNDKDRMPFSVVPQDEKMQAIFGIGFNLFGRMDDKKIDPLKPFKVRLTYRDVLGRKEERERDIDIRQFSGLPGVAAKSNEKKVADSLEGIEKHLQYLARQSSRFTGLVDLTKLDDRYVQKEKGEL